MPRPKKRIDEIAMLLEVAIGKLSELDLINEPTTILRIEQALNRYPDLDGLLSPVLDELETRRKMIVTTRAMVSTAKSVVKKLDT
jgi:hypothetical protein